VSAALLAHQPVAPDAVWSAWAGQPAVLVVLVGLALPYAWGLRAARDRVALQPVLRRRQRAAVAAGTVLVVALASPLDAAAASVFWAHMIQHLLLSAVAAPLLVLAAPIRTVRLGLAPPGRRALDQLRVPLAGDGAVRRWAAVLATGGALATLSVWHLPALYDAALESELVHAVEHATILGTGIAFWWAVIASARRHQVLPAVGALAVACIHGGALGALLALSSRPWYPVHAERARAWGLDPVVDQQAAGAIMWVPSAAVYLAAMAVILLRWFAHVDRRDRAGAAVTPPARRADAAASAAP
jgi:putative membrane protein